MKIAVLADPHANIVALREVLKEISKFKVSKFIIAGDLVGYGPDPKVVINAVKKLDAIIIRGNHDDSVVKRDYTLMTEYAAAAAEWTASVLDKESIEYLESLKFERSVDIEGKKIGVYHGSPENPFDYIMQEEVARELLRRSSMDIIICGHTHVPMWVEEKGKIFLNPGGVGQPRDQNWRASFAILDLSSPKKEIHRIEYDVHSVQKKMIEISLPRFLSDRLALGI